MGKQTMKVYPTAKSAVKNQVDELTEIRSTRGKTHGDFNEGAEVFDALAAPINQALVDGQIDKTQYYGLIMAMSKVTRILVGDPSEKDHWMDAANYLLLGGNIDGER